MSAVLAALARYAESRPGALALHSGDRRVNYAELHQVVSETADALRGVLRDGAGCVAVSLDNGVAWVVLDLALAKIGRGSLPIPPFFSPWQTGNALVDAGADWLISSDGNGAPLHVGEECVWIRRLDGDASRLPASTAKVSYTSGSTGAPKGVCLSRAQMERVALSIVERFGVAYAERHAAVLPLSVLLENVAGLYPTLLAGACYVAEAAHDMGCADPFAPDFARMGATLVRASATSLILVPELLRGLMAARAAGAFELPELRLLAVGGAKVAPDLLAEAHKMGLPAYEGYGLTECASVVAVNAPNGSRKDTVGRPLAHASLAISAEGEIIAHGETFIGYAGQAPHAGPHFTGDVGEIDDDGFLRVLGRKDNLIITSFGRNIAPEWVESELLSEPTIRHAIAFGAGQREVGALIVPLWEHLTKEQVAFSIERANARLPAYARVARFKIIPPLNPSLGEVTGNGRPRRQTLLTANAAFVNG